MLFTTIICFSGIEKTSLFSCVKRPSFLSIIFKKKKTINKTEKLRKCYQGFIQEKTGSENGPFTKIGHIKTNPSRKSVTIKRTLQKNMRDLKTDPKIKNYYVIFHTRSVANDEFTKK